MRLPLHPRYWIRRNPVRVYFVAIALAIVPLSLFIPTAHKMLVRQATSRLITQGVQSGQRIGAQIERHLNGTAVMLQVLALRRDFVSDWQHAQYELLSNDLEQVHTLFPQYALLALCDPSGVLRAASRNPSQLLNQSLADRDWYIRLTQHWTPYVSSVYPARVAPHQPLVTVAVPLRDASGQPIAILLASETLDSVTQEVYGFMSGQDTGLVSFVDQRGQAFGKRVEHVELMSDLAPAVQLLRQGEKPSSRQVTMKGHDYVIAYSPISSLKWGVLIQVPIAAINAALWQYERSIAVVGLLIVTLALGVGAVVARVYRKLRSDEERYLSQIERQNRELERDRREAEHANRMKSRFVASMSHELRTPLNAILGFAALLRDSFSDAPRERRWADHIHNAGTHLLKLINDVLDLSKIEAGKMELQREECAAEAVVPEVVATLEPLLVAKQIELQLDVELGLNVFADRVRLKQILYNLMSNAVKFSHAGGSVQLLASRQNGTAVFAVQDAGIGIAEEDQARIFSEFGRLQSQTEGTGLGLAITRRLVEQHGGELSLESKLGRGSTFRFSLPLVSDPPIATVSGSPEAPSLAQ